MRRVVDRALPLWGMGGAAVRLIAARENHVYRLDWRGRAFALRLHRRDYRDDAELRSELDWMAAMGTRGIGVPAPVQAMDGAYLHVVDGVQADMLHWIDAAPFDLEARPPGDTARSDHFQRLGGELARFHAACDAWTPPPGFTRPAWDAAGLVGAAPLWGRFWDNPHLTADARQAMLRLRDHGREVLPVGGADYGLIHADPVGENVLTGPGGLYLIDYDDGGFGYRLFDLATALVKTSDAPDHAALRAALLGGYRAVRALDAGALDLFLALRAATYLGWIVPRMAEDGAETRNIRFIERALRLVRAL